MISKNRHRTAQLNEVDSAYLAVPAPATEARQSAAPHGVPRHASALERAEAGWSVLWGTGEVKANCSFTPALAAFVVKDPNVITLLVMSRSVQAVVIENGILLLPVEIPRIHLATIPQADTASHVS